MDAAWTDKEPSGVALLLCHEGRWRCLRVAPSYEAFCKPFNWGDQIKGNKPDAAALLDACSTLLDHSKPTVVAVDIPLATINPIIKRRHADDVVSKRYGARKCAAHSPTPERPGATSTRIYEDFKSAGYTLALGNDNPEQALIEVYPHVALLKLMAARERLPYKAGKTTIYWKDQQDTTKRKHSLVQQWGAILQHLKQEIDGIDIPIPNDPSQLTFQHLKRYEDAIDALVCAWMAACFCAGEAEPLGDDTAAIWVPYGA